MNLDQALATWKLWNLGLTDVPKLVSEYSDGISNRSFLIAGPTHKYVLRLNSLRADQLGVVRADELDILRALSPFGFAPRLAYSDPEQRFQVFHHIAGRQWRPHDLRKLQNVHALEELIERFQKIHPPIRTLNYLAHLEFYQRQLPELQHSLGANTHSDFLHFKRRVIAYFAKPFAPVLCHHDLSPENIVETDSGLVVLDWEYAALGHPDFDKCCVARHAGMASPNPLLTEYIHWLENLWTLVNAET